MPRLIVVIPVPLQYPAQRYASGDEQQIGGQNHQDHRDKEQRQRLHRLLNGHRHKVGDPQQHRTQQRHKQVAFRRLFAAILAVQQGDGAPPPHLYQCADQRQQEDGQIDQRRLRHNTAPHRKGEFHLRLNGGAQAHLHRKGQRHAQNQSRHQRDGRRYQRLDGAQQREMPLAQTQHVVQAELPLPPPDQKGIGVEQKQRREHRNDPAAQPQNNMGRAAALHVPQQVAAAQLAHHIMRHHHAHAGEDIGQVQPLIFPDAVPRQSCVQAHCASPPVVSAVSAWEIRW